MVGIDNNLATVLDDCLADDVVLVILRLLVGAVEQALNATQTEHQSTVSSRTLRLHVVTASGILQMLVKHFEEFSNCQRTYGSATINFL